MMNDLQKKEVPVNKDPFSENVSGKDNPHRDASFYKKLGLHLLLLYRAYLKGETELEPEIRMAVWRMTVFDRDFSQKLRMAQMDSLKTKTFPGEHQEFTQENLFPDDLITKAVPNEQQARSIEENKRVVNGLLASYIK